MKLSTMYQKNRRNLTKILPYPGKKLPSYPNYDIPKIKRDLENFEKLLNMFGFFSESSGIEEIGTYDLNYLDLSMNNKGELNVYFTFRQLLFQVDDTPLRSSYSLILNKNCSSRFSTNFLYNVFKGYPIENFPLWERYYDLQFNALKGYINNNNYNMRDELLERYEEEERLRIREAALIQLLY